MAELYCINNVGQDYEVIAEPESISLDGSVATIPDNYSIFATQIF
jgi:hypothetical protein